MITHMGSASMRSKVTLGVCVRNCEGSVKDVIYSILNQDCPHDCIEVIFVDDGSEDRTLSVILDSISMMDMQVKVFHHEWQGLGQTRNVVVDNAEGDYIIWVDGDMILPRDHVRKQVEFMERNPKVGIAKAKIGILPGEKLVATLENVPFMLGDRNNKIVESNPPGTGGSIYRVEAIRQVGGFDDQFKGAGEDQDAAFRVREAGWSLVKSSALFHERRAQTWKGLWDKYFWYGYGDYRLYHKNRSIFSLHKMVPPAGFVAGLLYSLVAYKLTYRKAMFLLPLHFVFKMTAWCFGFAKGQIDFINSRGDQ